MDIVFKKSEGLIRIGDKTFPASIPMLRLVDGTRAKDNIARTIPGNFPYDPEPFPNGRFIVTGIFERADKYRAPFFIATDATRKVPIWGTTPDGLRYDKASSRTCIDSGYGIHFSLHPTTQGCIKVKSKADLIEIVVLIRAAWGRKETVFVEVSD